jgi:hypothetical protein
MSSQNKDVKVFRSVAQERNYPTLPLSVGLVVASIHFLVAYLSDLAQLNYGFILIAPYFILLTIASNYLPLGYIIGPLEDSPTFDTVLEVFAILVSSCCYGLIGGLLASRRKALVLIAIIIVVMLILCGALFLVGLIAQLSA